MFSWLNVKRKRQFLSPSPWVLLLGLLLLCIPQFSWGTDSIICAEALRRVTSGNLNPTILKPRRRFELVEGASLIKYRENVWSISSPEGQPKEWKGIAALVSNLPTGESNEVLYVIGHGSEKRGTLSSGRRNGRFSADEIWEAIEETKSLRDQFKAVVVLACHGGSCEGKIDGETSATLKIAKASGLTTLGPTGVLRINVPEDKETETLLFEKAELQVIQNPLADEDRWTIASSKKSRDIFPFKHAQEITNYYKRWEETSHILRRARKWKEKEAEESSP